MFEDRTLWRFCCDVYSCKQVETLCLNLQDEHGVDIPLVLFCIWSGANYGVLSAHILYQAAQVAQSWSQTVVRPIRKVRRQLKIEHNLLPATDTAPFHSHIKAMELGAEQLLLFSLERLLDDYPKAEGDVIVESCMANIVTCMNSEASHTERELFRLCEIVLNSADSV